MKKLITLAFALVCMVCTFAADFDLIIKTNSEKIEAIIQEVSDTDIKYKKASNPNGPLFVVKLDEVATILYANGDVQAVEHKAANTYVFDAPESAEKKPAYDFSYVANGPMQRMGNTYLIEGHKLKGKELKFFLEERCPVAYNHYVKWDRVKNAGWSVMAVGLAMSIVGTGLWIDGYNYAKSTGFDSDVSKPGFRREKAGIFMVVIGSTVSVASVPLICVGTVKKRNVQDVYNEACGQPQAFRPELHLQASENGLGLALHF